MNSRTGPGIPGALRSCRTWAGQGTGQRCALCGRSISAQEIEYEVELDSGKILHFHFACQQDWEAQSG